MLWDFNTGGLPNKIGPSLLHDYYSQARQSHVKIAKKGCPVTHLIKKLLMRTSKQMKI